MSHRNLIREADAAKADPVYQLAMRKLKGMEGKAAAKRYADTIDGQKKHPAGATPEQKELMDAGRNAARRYLALTRESEKGN